MLPEDHSLFKFLVEEPEQKLEITVESTPTSTVVPKINKNYRELFKVINKSKLNSYELKFLEDMKLLVNNNFNLTSRQESFLERLVSLKSNVTRKS